MKIINFDQIRSLDIAPKDCVRWVEEALQLKYSCQIPHKISIKLGDGSVFFNTMPCHIPKLERFGVKEVSRYPERDPSISGEILLYDSADGALLALMDANWITAMRTGAVAACSISKLKSSSASSFSFIGLGNTARATLLCLLDANPDTLFQVKLLEYKDQAPSFISRFADFGNVSFEVVKSREALIREADVVVSCVTVANDLIGQDEWFKEGVLVVPVHTRGFQNCDLFFDKVFADDEGHVEGFKHFHEFKKFEELARVLLGKAAGRECDTERILAYNIGIALHDVYFASRIYDRVQSGASEVHLRGELPKFWV